MQAVGQRLRLGRQRVVNARIVPREILRGGSKDDQAVAVAVYADTAASGLQHGGGTAYIGRHAVSVVETGPPRFAAQGGNGGIQRLGPAEIKYIEAV